MAKEQLSATVGLSSLTGGHGEAAAAALGLWRAQLPPPESGDSPGEESL